VELKRHRFRAMWKRAGASGNRNVRAMSPIVIPKTNMKPRREMSIAHTVGPQRSWPGGRTDGRTVSRDPRQRTGLSSVRRAVDDGQTRLSHHFRRTRLGVASDSINTNARSDPDPCSLELRDCKRNRFESVAVFPFDPFLRFEWDEASPCTFPRLTCFIRTTTVLFSLRDMIWRFRDCLGR